MSRFIDSRLLVWLITIVLLAGCQTVPTPDQSADTPLTNTYWKLMSVHGQAATVGNGQREPHIVLNAEEHRVQGYTGCNSLAGSYKRHDRGLTFNQIVTTRMFCANAADTEQNLLDALEHTARAHVQQDQLTLEDADGQPLARFESRLMQ